MRKVAKARDVNGHTMQKGDTVVTLSDNTTARVCDLAVETDQTEFVCLRGNAKPEGCLLSQV